VLIDLVPAFLGVLDAPDPEHAYRQYRNAHKAVLDAYWRNYVLDPDSEPAQDVVRRALAADRRDLHAVLASRDLRRDLEDVIARAHDVLGLERQTDVYLMVGMGGANAGELVVNGRPAVVLCLEHFTGRPNPDTYGLGLSPDLLGLWAAHELAHTVRYTAAGTRSEIARLIQEQGGQYDWWQTGSRAALRELLVNEGLAVHAAMRCAPGHEAPHYFGYARRQYMRIRELEAFLHGAVQPDLDRRALGLRLRWLSGGTSPAARLVQGRVIPERAGYYLGWRMADAGVVALGLRNALRAGADELGQLDAAERGVQTA
jgi:hypothetical protein